MGEAREIAKMTDQELDDPKDKPLCKSESSQTHKMTGVRILLQFDTALNDCKDTLVDHPQHGSGGGLSKKRRNEITCQFQQQHTHRWQVCIPSRPFVVESVMATNILRLWVLFGFENSGCMCACVHAMQHAQRGDWCTLVASK